MINFSVIIPAYNRADLIGNSIKSLIDQTISPEVYEILVCDNNSTDNTKEVVESFFENQRCVKVHYYQEKRQGVHYARNSTALKAKGSYLYFTDDDMIADSKMLEEFDKWILKFPDLAVLGGKVFPKWECPPPYWLVQYFCDSTLSLTNNYLDVVICKTDPGIASCHQLIRKDVFLEAGGFRPEYTKDEWLGDGECGLNREISKLGYSFGSFSSALTQHVIPKERMTMKYICKRYKNQGQADAFTYLTDFKPTKLKLQLGHLKHLLISYYLNLKALFLVFSLRKSWRLALAKSAQNKGYSSYLLKFFRSEKLRRFSSQSSFLD